MVFVRARDDFSLVEEKRGYVVPLRNTPITIFQGYNGLHSHKVLVFRGGNGEYFHDDRFSLDFAAAYGTPIVAARRGVVSARSWNKDEYYEGLNITPGVYLWTNHVVLDHLDGTYALYSHLESDSVAELVRGTIVEQGEHLAFTGRSGWVGPVPHLHFAALRYDVKPHLYRRTFPVKFDDYAGELDDTINELLQVMGHSGWG